MRVRPGWYSGSLSPLQAGSWGTGGTDLATSLLTLVISCLPPCWLGTSTQDAHCWGPSCQGPSWPCARSAPAQRAERGWGVADVAGNRVQLAAPRRSPDLGVSSRAEVERLGEEKVAGEGGQEFPVLVGPHLGTTD